MEEVKYGEIVMIRGFSASNDPRDPYRDMTMMEVDGAKVAITEDEYRSLRNAYCARHDGVRFEPMRIRHDGRFEPA